MPELPEASEKHSNRHWLMGLLNSFDRLIEQVEKLILGGSVLFLTGLLVLHVLARQLLDGGINGQVELTQFSLVMMTFGGLGYAVRRARHIAMSAFYDQLRGGPRKALLVFICLCAGTLMLFLAWHAWDYVDSVRVMARSSSALGIPIWIPYLIVPTGFVLAGIQYWLTAIRNLTSDRIYRSFTELEAYDDVPVDGADQG